MTDASSSDRVESMNPLLDPFQDEEIKNLKAELQSSIDKLDDMNNALKARRYFDAAGVIHDLLEIHRETVLGLEHIHTGMIAEIQKHHGG